MKKKRKYHQKTVWASGVSGAKLHIDSYYFRVVSVEKIGRKKYPGKKSLYKYRIKFTKRD